MTDWGGIMAKIHGTDWQIDWYDWGPNGRDGELAANLLKSKMEAMPAEIIQAAHAEYIAAKQAGENQFDEFLNAYGSRRFDAIDDAVQASTAEIMAGWVSVPTSGYVLDCYPQ